MNQKIALVTYQQQARYNEGVTESEDEQLLKFLQGKGIDITPVVWNAPEVNWRQYDVAIIKSPWDYHDQIDAFYAWLKTTEQAGIRLLNSADMVRWNSNKQYLLEIADAGLSIIPSQLLVQGSTPDWGTFFSLWNTDKIVVKPCVSAGAKNTVLLSVGDIAAQRESLNALLQAEDFLVQPYLEEIKEGEWSFVFFGGVFSHMLLKTPRQGDFRVQHYHGGTFKQASAGETMISKAQQYVDHFGKGSLYVRVDGIIKADEFYLMELEMIEPYLFLSIAAQGYENYYQALRKLLAFSL